MKIFFVVNYSKRNAVEKAKKVMGVLKKLNCDCAVDEQNSNFFDGFAIGEKIENLGSYNFIIAIGGDGTVILASKIAIKFNLPLLGINAGHMGFLCGLEFSELENLKNLVYENYFIRERMLLKVSYKSNEWIAINDAIVAKPTYHGFVNLKVYDGDSFIISYRADSVLFSTPTGSTAYSLSNGGPIADPSLEFISMAPICAHSLISRTNLFSPDSILNVEIGSENEACLILDGVAIKLLKQNSVVQIKQSEKKLKLIYLKDVHFFELVKNKFFKV